MPFGPDNMEASGINNLIVTLLPFGYDRQFFSRRASGLEKLPNNSRVSPRTGALAATRGLDLLELARLVIF